VNEGAGRRGQGRGTGRGSCRGRGRGGEGRGGRGRGGCGRGEGEGGGEEEEGGMEGVGVHRGGHASTVFMDGLAGENPEHTVLFGVGSFLVTDAVQ